MRGATDGNKAVYLDISISIHAPHAGCDDGIMDGSGSETDFNPRTPCGVRRRACIKGAAAEGFQSTHPMRGATPCRCSAIVRSRYFNPRTPCGVRLASSLHHVKYFLISIHAPHAGCDFPSLSVNVRIVPKFQSTHPMRGATRGRRKLWLPRNKISIHAPHAGCDVCPVCGEETSVYISIHAPHAGCDTLKRLSTQKPL